MPDMPLVSVIIPTFNNAGSLKAAIDSVLAQQRVRTQIIVINDGSTDHTDEIMQSFPDITYLKQENQGPGGSRNTGMLKAKGDFLCFLDADDVLLPNSLALRIHVFEKNPDVELVFSDFHRINPNTGPIKNFLKSQNFLSKFEPCIEKQDENSVVFAQNYIEYAVLYFPYIWTSCVMLRGHVVSKVGLFEKVWKGSEDIDYWLRVGELGKFAFVKQALTVWNHHQSTITKMGHVDFYRDTLICYERIKQKIKSKKHLKKAVNKRLAHYAFAGGYEALSSYKLNLARKYFFRALLYRASVKSWLYACLSLMPSKLFYILRRVKQKAHTASYYD